MSLLKDLTKGPMGGIDKMTIQTVHFKIDLEGLTNLIREGWGSGILIGV